MAKRRLDEAFTDVMAAGAQPVGMGGALTASRPLGIAPLMAPKPDMLAPLGLPPVGSPEETPMSKYLRANYGNNPAGAMRARSLLLGAGGGIHGRRARSSYGQFQGEEEAATAQARTAAAGELKHQRALELTRTAKVEPVQIREAGLAGRQGAGFQFKSAEATAAFTRSKDLQNQKSAAAIELQTLKGSQALGQLSAQGEQRLEQITLQGAQDLALMERESDLAEKEGDKDRQIAVLKSMNALRGKLSETLAPEDVEAQLATAGAAAPEVAEPSRDETGQVVETGDLNNDGVIDERDRRIAVINRILLKEDLTDDQFKNITTELRRLKAIKPVGKPATK